MIVITTVYITESYAYNIMYTELHGNLDGDGMNYNQSIKLCRMSIA